MRPSTYGFIVLEQSRLMSENRDIVQRIVTWLEESYKFSREVLERFHRNVHKRKYGQWVEAFAGFRNWKKDSKGVLS